MRKIFNINENWMFYKDTAEIPSVACENAEKVNHDCAEASEPTQQSTVIFLKAHLLCLSALSPSPFITASVLFLLVRPLLLLLPPSLLSLSLASD